MIGRIGNTALAQVASALSVAENYEQACQTVEGIGDPRDKARALSAVAEAAVKMGDPTKAAALIKHARQTAEGVGESVPKAGALGAVAEATAKIAAETKDSALIKHARQTAEGIGEPVAKAWALKDIARSYARLEYWRQARQIAELNTTDDGRAMALAAILEVWAERQNPALAKVRVEEK